MVKAATNKSQVLAKIISIKETDQPNVFSVTLEIVNSSSVEGYENFLTKQIGKSIDAEIYRKKIEPSKKSITILLRYQGDEHGDIYYGSLD